MLIWYEHLVQLTHLPGQAKHEPLTKAQKNMTIAHYKMMLQIYKVR